MNNENNNVGNEEIGEPIKFLQPEEDEQIINNSTTSLEEPVQMEDNSIEQPIINEEIVNNEPVINSFVDNSGLFQIVEDSNEQNTNFEPLQNDINMGVEPIETPIIENDNLPKKSNKKVIIMIIIGVVILVIIGVIAYLLLNKQDKVPVENKPNESTIEEVVPQINNLSWGTLQPIPVINSLDEEYKIALRGSCKYEINGEINENIDNYLNLRIQELVSASAYRVIRTIDNINDYSSTISESIEQEIINSHLNYESYDIVIKEFVVLDINVVEPYEGE